MISYQIYKVMHLLSIFLFLTGASVLLIAGRKRFWMILTGLASFFILFAGMGLMARLGAGFASWVVAKIFVWLVITALGHVVAKRFPAWGMGAYWCTIFLAGMAVYFAVYKPIF